MRSTFYTYISLIFILLVTVTTEEAVSQQVNTLPQPVDSAWHPSPRKAALYSATFPGLGQIYNKKYWKIPIVYAGFATLGYFIWFNTTHYDEFRNAYLDFTDVDPETASYLNLIGPGIDPADFDNVLYPESTTYTQANHDYFQGQLKSNMDYYHRNRDLSFIGTVGWYILTVLDAVVDAQLFDYDISDNLTLNMLPVSRPIGRQGVIGLTCTIQF